MASNFMNGHSDGVSSLEVLIKSVFGCVCVCHSVSFCDVVYVVVANSTVAEKKLSDFCCVAAFYSYPVSFRITC